MTVESNRHQVMAIAYITVRQGELKKKYIVEKLSIYIYIFSCKLFRNGSNERILSFIYKKTSVKKSGNKKSIFVDSLGGD